MHSHNEISPVDVKVGIFTGGWTPESEISYQSAEAVAKALRAKEYSTAIFYVTSNGIFLHSGGLKLKVTLNNEICDIGFVIIHGSPGENGLLHAYFDIIQLPYIGSSFDVLSITMNKHATKAFLSPLVKDIKMPRWTLLRKNNLPAKFDDIFNSIKFPLLIKPNNLGSSIGVFLAHNKESFHHNLHECLKFTNEVIVEEYIKGREITCGVIEYKNGVEPLAITEIIAPEGRFFDYKAKYSDPQTQEITPANIPQELYKFVLSKSEEIFKILGCSIFARIDFILSNSDLYFLEINTIPGLTPKSLLPQQLNYKDIALGDLIDYHIKQKIAKFYPEKL